MTRSVSFGILRYFFPEGEFIAGQNRTGGSRKPKILWASWVKEKFPLNYSLFLFPNSQQSSQKPVQKETWPVCVLWSGALTLWVLYLSQFQYQHKRLLVFVWLYFSTTMVAAKAVKCVEDFQICCFSFSSCHISPWTPSATLDICRWDCMNLFVFDFNEELTAHII